MSIDKPLVGEPRLPSDDDKVILPAHYAKFAIEPIEFIMMNDLPYWCGNVIKYVVRAGSKKYDDLSLVESEKRDLQKAARYIEMRLLQLEDRSVKDTGLILK